MKAKFLITVLFPLLFLSHYAMASDCDRQWETAWQQCDGDYSSKSKACFSLADKYKPTCVPSNTRIIFDRYADKQWRISGNNVQVQGSSAELFEESKYALTEAWLKFTYEEAGWKIYYETSDVNLLCNEQNEDKVGVEEVIDVNNQPVKFIQRKSCSSVWKENRGFQTSVIYSNEVMTNAGFDFVVEALRAGPLRIGIEYSEDHPFENGLKREFAKSSLVHISNNGWGAKINEMNYIQEKNNIREKTAL